MDEENLPKLCCILDGKVQKLLFCSFPLLLFQLFLFPLHQRTKLSMLIKFLSPILRLQNTVTHISSK